MASVQVKPGWKRPRRRKNKNYRSVPFLHDALPIFEKLKNTIMASFQAKTGLKRMRKRENKNYHYVSFLSDA